MVQFFKVIKLLPYYDSMVCKLICHGRNRTEAIQRMNRSLDEFVIEGITTTIPLHKKLLNHKKFINSDFNVSWLDNEKIFNYNQLTKYHKQDDQMVLLMDLMKISIH